MYNINNNKNKIKNNNNKINKIYLILLANINNIFQKKNEKNQFIA